MDLRMRTLDLKLDLMRQIVDGDRQESEIMRKLEEAEATEHRFWNNTFDIRTDAKLKVHIVDAVNLPENCQSYVNVAQGGCDSTTNVRVGSGPIWNEAIVFNIVDPSQMVLIQVMDDYNGRIIFQSQIDLTDDEIRNYKQMGQDIWIRHDDARESPNEDSPKLRIRLHYSYSDRERYRSMIEEWQTEILKDLENLKKVK